MLLVGWGATIVKFASKAAALMASKVQISPVISPVWQTSITMLITAAQDGVVRETHRIIWRSSASDGRQMRSWWRCAGPGRAHELLYRFLL